MPDIFLSYASADRERVGPLVTALQARGWSVWWDREIEAGADFQRRIQRALADARCVIVVWTGASVRSQWVRAEATDAFDRRILVPVLLEPVQPGAPFNLLNGADLAGWKGAADAAEFQRLARGVEAKLEGRLEEKKAYPGAPRVPGHGSTWLRWAAVAGMAALAVAVAVLVPRQPQRPAAAANSIAVLPFTNLGAPADAYRSQGLSLEILAQLARLPELAVVSPTSSFASLGASADAGQALGVRFLVEGSVRPEGDGETIDLSLIEASNRRILWSDHRKVQGDELTAVPRDAARSIIAKFDVPLSEESRRRLEARTTDNPQALDAYLQGIALLRMRAGDQSLARAEDAFRKAIALDGKYAMPHAGLCRVQVRRYQRTLDAREFGAAEQSCGETLALDALQSEPHKALGELYLASGRLDDSKAEFLQARRLATRDADALIGLADVADRRNQTVDAEKLYRDAIALEPVYWRTHAALGRFLFGHARYADAVAAFRRTVELEPEQARGWEDLGGTYYMAGAFEDALAAWQKALSLEPGPSAYSNVGTAELFLRRFDDSVVNYRQAIALSPRDHRWHGQLADALRVAGRPGEARASYERAAELARENLAVDPSDAETKVRLASYDAALGRVELARLALEETLGLTRDDPYLYYDAAVAWANMGKTAQALEALRNAIRLGYPPPLIAADPLFDSLRSTEGFRRIVS